MIKSAFPLHRRHCCRCHLRQVEPNGEICSACMQLGIYCSSKWPRDRLVCPASVFGGYARNGAVGLWKSLRRVGFQARLGRSLIFVYDRVWCFMHFPCSTLSIAILVRTKLLLETSLCNSIGSRDFEFCVEGVR